MRESAKIDLDTTPFVPDGWEIESHRGGGCLTWDPDKAMFICARDESEGLVFGDVLLESLKTQPILNANVLDYLLAHQEAISEKWLQKRGFFFFWGTIYRVGAIRYVRYLYKSALQLGWKWGHRGVDGNLLDIDYIVLYLQ